MSRKVLIVFAVLLLISVPASAGPERDFSGTWLLDRSAGNFRDLAPPAESVKLTQSESRIEFLWESTRWVIPIDGKEVKSKLGDETWNTMTKWEGAALLINALVTGPRDYTVMDYWRLSPDQSTLTINRQVMRGTAQAEGTVVYRRPGTAPAPAPAPSGSETRPTPSPGALVRRPEPTPPPARAKEYVVPAGTRILLSLINSVNTKHSRDGDRVYLQTAFPVSIDGRTVIPKGANVTGTVSNSKRPGRVAGKGELYIRFDDLTLPNGVTRDFRARIASSDSATGEVDRKEGTIRSDGNKSGDARTVATGAGIGETLGGAVGRSVGTAGVGGAAGAAAGLATVLMKRGPDASLPKGTQVEMVLDRDLIYRVDELK
jgi:hypothetical protein